MLHSRAARICLAVMLVAMLAMGCAGQQKKDVVKGTYRALSIGGNSYDAAMSGVADLYKQGHIGEAEKAKALELANAYHDAYHVAVEALKTYAETDVESGELQEKLLRVGAALGKLLEYINPLLGKYGMEVIE